MKKQFLRILLLSLFLLQIRSTRADEGMWLPLLIDRLNYQDMQSKGLHLSVREIYDVNNSSLKDAIVRLGRGFCTAEVVSSQGLLLTNHHCAYDLLQTHSTVERDFLNDGFWAMDKDQELPNEGLTATFLIRIEDVTDRVLSQLTHDMSEEDRGPAVAKIGNAISTEASQDGRFEAVVKEFFHGNEYYLFVSKTYLDVRLVGAPPESIGKFGGDTDNWMWPRHTGDFSMLRIYTGTDGEPAAYSKDNIPLEPKHHLPISLNGVKPGDYTMVMGYPGSTDRYLTSYGVELALDQVNPTRVSLRDKRLKLLKQDMDQSPGIRLQYASKYARVSNYWKYFIGQSQGLKRLKVLDQKKEIEDNFRAWYSADSERKQLYGQALSMIEDGYKAYRNPNVTRLHLQEAVFGSEILPFSYRHRALEAALEEGDESALSEIVDGLRAGVRGHFKNYHTPTDQKVTAALIGMYYRNVKPGDHPEVFKMVAKKYKGDTDRFIANIFQNSIFSTEQKYLAFLSSPNLKTIQKDPAYSTSTSIMDHYNQNVKPEINQARSQIKQGNRLFIDGLRKMTPQKTYYPDANSTMRLSYGQILDYSPKDGVTYHFMTTANGIIQKENPDDPEFIVPSDLIHLIGKADFGKYGQDGKLVVGFISNNDITGGNSGSPVINGNGELVGIAFDGNWEAMSGDIAFEPTLQRCISVDIRYVLFIVDKLAGAGHLVEEMTLINVSSTIRND